MRISTDRWNHIVIGTIIVAVGASAIYAFGHNGSDTGCGVTAAGAAVITEGVLRGHDSKAILASAGTAVASESACKDAVKKLVDEPEEQVGLTISTPTGEEAAVETSGRAMQETTSEPQRDFGRSFDCFASYRESEFLDSLCFEGLLEP